MDRIARALLSQHILHNPLPWKVDRDWTYEVIASNGVTIAKCSSNSEAMDIISAGKSLKEELDLLGEETDPLITPL